MQPKLPSAPIAFLVAVLLSACFCGALPEAQAVRLSVTPATATTVPGGTATFDVELFMEKPFLAPQHTLFVYPLEPGVNVTFSPSSGFPNTVFYSTMSVKVDVSKPPGEYILHVWANTLGGNPDPTNPSDAVKLVVVLARTDWQILADGMSPLHPEVGDLVTFASSFKALSSDQPFPQAVKVIAELDGAVLMSLSQFTYPRTYPGDIGFAADVLTVPWTATVGKHTIVWVVDPGPPYACNDPDRSNNQITRVFTVGAATTAVSSSTVSTAAVSTASVTPTWQASDSLVIAIAIVIAGAIIGLSIAFVKRRDDRRRRGPAPRSKEEIRPRRENEPRRRSRSSRRS